MSNPMRERLFVKRPESTPLPSFVFAPDMSAMRTKADILRIFLLCHPMRRAWLLDGDGWAEGNRFGSEMLFWLYDFTSSYFSAGTL